MIGWTLGRYFLLRHMVLTSWLFVGLFLLVFIINFTEISRRMSDASNYSINWALGFAGLQTPMIMQQAIPFVCLISAMAALISLNRKYELVVARAAGISAWQFLTPICISAFIWGLGIILLLNPIAAYGLSRTQLMEVEVRGGTPSARTSGPTWIKQRTGEGETYIGAEAASADGSGLAGVVFIRVDSAGALTERLNARTATLHEGHWELNDVMRVREGQLPEVLASAEIETNLNREFVTERLVNPETIPIFDLPRKIAAARSFGLSANGFAMQFHSLTALPLLLVAMTLIAASVSMRFARMGQSAPIILGGIASGFLLYVVSVLVKAFGTAGIVPPAAAAWFPVVLAGLFGVTFLLYKEDG